MVYPIPLDAQGDGLEPQEGDGEMDENMQELCDKHFGPLWQDNPNKFWRMYTDVRANTKGANIPLTDEEWHVILASLEIAADL